MKMSGENPIAAGREAVWAALNDPVALKEAIPGAETVTKTAEDEFEAVVNAKVGPVRATFKGKIKLSDIDPPNGYTIAGEGTGGAAGFAKGSAKVSLRDGEAGTTILAYDVDAAVGGKLAQIGQRLIQGTAKKMADEFFANFAARFGAPSVAAPAPSPDEAPSVMAQAPSANAPGQLFGMPRERVFVILAAVVAAIVIYAATR